MLPLLNCSVTRLPFKTHLFLIVSDMETIIIHTNFTNTVQEIHTIPLEDLLDFETRRKLRWIFTEPARFRPGVTRQAVTEKAAKAFASVAQRLRD